MMRIGISIGTTFSSGGPAGDREGPRYVLSQARAAARASLDTLSLGDHHSTGPALTSRMCRCSAASWPNGRTALWAAFS